MYAKILVCLDGSDPSLMGGHIALKLAESLGSELIATHIYDVRIHSARFREMEPVLPERYQEEKRITALRESHQRLISEGFSALSLGYMERFMKQARSSGVEVREAHREGRNYVELYNLVQELCPDLLVMGAHGLGRLNDRIGSTAARLLRLAACDVLIAREKLGQGLRALVGIDGSADALEGLRKGVQWARVFGGSASLAAAYDPAFHSQVFRTMGQSLSETRQQEVGLNKQQELHDQIIDDGLGQLYRVFLDQAAERCRSGGAPIQSHLLQGKAFHALVEYARSSVSNLVIVGRFGHHRQPIVSIGSNSEAVAHLAATNVLVTRPPLGSVGSRQAGASGSAEHEVRWEKAAETALQRVPSFARPMARAAVEEAIRQRGGRTVTLEDFREVAARFGMKPGGGPPPGKEAP